MGPMGPWDPWPMGPHGPYGALGTFLLNFPGPGTPLKSTAPKFCAKPRQNYVKSMDGDPIYAQKSFWIFCWARWGTKWYVLRVPSGFLTRY